LPLALIFIFWEFWQYYIYIGYLRSQKWLLLEIKIPTMIEKDPKAMEQVFAAAYGIYSYGFRFWQKYWEGRLQEDFISFELVGYAGSVHFYIRTPDSYRNLIESAIYAQYPNAEIHLAEDYRNLMPKTLPNEVYDIWGTDYHLSKDDAYPIRTYEYFEASVKEKRLDPIAAITEVMSKLKDDEALWIQIFIRPTGDDWKKKGEALRDTLVGRKKPGSPPGFLEKIWQFFRNLVIAPIEHPVWPEDAKREEQQTRMLLMTPGEKDIIEGLERKIGMLAFQTNIRFIYIDKRDSFTRSNVAATMSTFNQFNTQNLNSLRPNTSTFTIARGLFKKRKLWYRKRRLYDSYQKLMWPKRKSILNVQELATLYHFPSIVVEAPMLRHLVSKKGEPPAGLPIE